MHYRNWQEELGKAARNSKSLAASKLCTARLAEAQAKAAELPARAGLLPFAVTPTILHGIRDRGSSFCADDPVAAQFLPTGNELVHLPWEESDPLLEAGFSGAQGLERRLVRQYPSRALVRATSGKSGWYPEES